MKRLCGVTLASVIIVVGLLAVTVPAFANDATLFVLNWIGSSDGVLQQADIKDNTATVAISTGGTRVFSSTTQCGQQRTGVVGIFTLADNNRLQYSYRHICVGGTFIPFEFRGIESPVGSLTFVGTFRNEGGLGAGAYTLNFAGFSTSEEEGEKFAEGAVPTEAGPAPGEPQ